ncbi:alpha/beta hydrolase [Fibrobacter succinogenes]|uniref:RBBP9/YdeN family alpha/beta hydrolase n=1 Tax=Fibrobacter succinogenes TaxID=833 RepID=UPI00156956AD|nr:alpha/beta hydrolase [Fibrobacter succinogenes]
MHYLIVPGLNNSDEKHWQTFWEKSLQNTSRVKQRDWDYPQRDEWVQALGDTIQKLDKDTIIIAHSLGVATTVIYLTQNQGKIPLNLKGAFLVSPSDVDNIEVIKSFAPMPLEKLPIPACVVASENDPFVSMERAEFFASAWGVKLFNAGKLGHINSATDLREWEQGRAFLAAFEQSI